VGGHGRLAEEAEGKRSDLAALYLWVAETLEESADLAEQHAERYRLNGRSDATEMASAKRAREAARRARASRLQ
jgi:phosphate uptake regulator